MESDSDIEIQESPFVEQHLADVIQMVVEYLEVGDTYVLAKIPDTDDQAVRLATAMMGEYIEEAGVEGSVVPVAQETRMLTDGEETWEEPIDDGTGIGIKRVE